MTRLRGAGAAATMQARHGGRTLWLVLAVVGAGVFFGTFDQTVVVTILPNMIDGLGLPAAKFGEATWIVNGYLLGYAVALPAVGSLADAYGHLRLFIICIAIFALGSAAVALAPNLEILVAARAFQAIGGGGVLPVAMAIAAAVLPSRRRPLALGALAATNNASSLLGPLWGAALVGAVGWRGVFWLNIPLILPVALLLPWLVREAAGGRRTGVDWAGALLLATAIGGATLALTDDGANPRPLVISLALGLAAVVAAVLFVRHELGCIRPMLQLRSFRERPFAAAMLMYFLIGGALIVALVDVPLMRNVLYHGSALQGGLDLMRLLLLLPAGGVVGGFLCLRAGRRGTALLGLALAIAGFLLMRAWPAAPSGRDLWLALGLIGFGLGLCDAPIVSTVIETARVSERATASAMLLILWVCGMITGLALLGTQGLGSFSTRAARLFREQGTNLDVAALEQIMRQTFNATFIGAGLALAAAIVLALFLEGGRDRSIRWSAVAQLER
jgi:MFS family permease